MMVQNAAEVVKVITTFYAQAFREIFQRGIDISSLQTVKYAIMPERMEQFKTMISQLRRLSSVIGEEMPSIHVFQGFYSLLEKMLRM